MTIEMAVKFYEKGRKCRERAVEIRQERGSPADLHMQIEQAEEFERVALFEVIQTLALRERGLNPEEHAVPLTYRVKDVRGAAPGSWNMPRWIGTLDCPEQHEATFVGFPKPEDIPARAACGHCLGRKENEIRPERPKPTPGTDALLLADAVREFLRCPWETGILPEALARYESNTVREEAPGEATTRLVYVVTEGDTLSQIGERFGVDWTEITRATRVTPGTYIYPGDRLLIPARKP